MKKATFEVTFTKNYTYTVVAYGDYEAEKIAYQEFKNDMSRPIADYHYDEVHIDTVEDNCDFYCKTYDEGKCEESWNCEHCTHYYY